MGEGSEKREKRRGRGERDGGRQGVRIVWQEGPLTVSGSSSYFLLTESWRLGRFCEMRGICFRCFFFPPLVLWICFFYVYLPSSPHSSLLPLLLSEPEMVGGGWVVWEGEGERGGGLRVTLVFCFLGACATACRVGESSYVLAWVGWVRDANGCGCRGGRGRMKDELWSLTFSCLYLPVCLCVCLPV